MLHPHRHVHANHTTIKGKDLKPANNNDLSDAEVHWTENEIHFVIYQCTNTNNRVQQG